ncbi:MAG: M20 family peptidase [Parvibaculum sp.]|uniref:M20 family peptidase n=1 Tax=Parvibaculum sp. TaxID=2024848 RepID=UPI0032F03371
MWRQYKGLDKATPRPGTIILTTGTAPRLTDMAGAAMTGRKGRPRRWRPNRKNDGAGDKSMLKRILIGAGALFVLLIAVVVGRTLMVPAAELANIGQAESIDAEGAAQHLAEAVRFRTISHQAGADEAEVARSAEAFEGFRNWMDATYPAFTAATKREIVGGATLFYTWEGTDTSLDPVLLMSHIDVVPIAPGTEDKWEHPPFAGTIADGYVWGRGTIDNKGSLIAMVEAAERLAAQGFQPTRTILFAFGHDEEIGGGEGNKALAGMLQERGVNLAWVKDEGGVIGHGLLPGVNAPVAMIGVAEKGSISLGVVAYSKGGHSSMPSPAAQTAIGRLARALERIGGDPFESKVDGATRGMIESLAPAVPFTQRMVYANLWLFEPLVRGVMEESPTSAAQLHTTIAPTIVEGGVKENVLPPEARAVVNFRIHPRDTADGIIEHVRAAVDDPDVEIEPLPGIREASKVSNIEGDGYQLITRVIGESFPGVIAAPYLVVGGTDSRHYLPITDNVFRFIPIRMAPEDMARFHGTNERVSVENMGEAVAFYVRLFETLKESDAAN